MISLSRSRSLVDGYAASVAAAAVIMVGVGAVVPNTLAGDTFQLFYIKKILSGLNSSYMIREFFL